MNSTKEGHNDQGPKPKGWLQKNLPKLLLLKKGRGKKSKEEAQNFSERRTDESSTSSSAGSYLSRPPSCSRKGKSAISRRNQHQRRVRNDFDEWDEDFLGRRDHDSEDECMALMVLLCLEYDATNLEENH
jgi:hypothetical protein